MVLPVYIEEILEILYENGYEAYVVGGCVRDSLMGRTPQDYDVTTSARPADIMRIFPRTAPTGEKYGTVTVLTDCEPVEVTTFRTDGDYPDGRRPNEVTFTASIEADLSRRDLTVNAIGYSHRTGYVDPFGGREDIDKQILRTVGDPAERFSEDALRILRVFRFAAALGFPMELGTVSACARLMDTLEKVSAERITAELSKALMGAYPVRLLPLFEWGGLSFLGFRPPGRQIAWNCLPADLSCRWAALLFLCGREAPLVILKRLRLDNVTKRLAGTMVTALGQALPQTPVAIKHFFHTVSTTSVHNFMLTYEVVNGASAERSIAVFERIMERNEPWNVSMLDIGGDDLIGMGIAEGQAVGEVLDILCCCVIERPEINEKEVLKMIATEYYGKFYL